MVLIFVISVLANWLYTVTLHFMKQVNYHGGISKATNFLVAFYLVGKNKLEKRTWGLCPSSF
ncbi:hypothetical protein HMPREF9517_02255 [Enterococcus faecalis TX1341]|uniref:Uncharacterized protein n=1 Tax=Enterococcus faecalis TaxID=1351 RepID=A0A4Q1YHM1_ENTFL|nr:hypothetical protein [Listeria monocytogenes]EFU11261.1 hypothetical protein HMPREF9517_02255 [Enterococcus faecalis TX1341]EGO8071661.1 hypothetical protein [Enterococcus faecalis]EPH77468.1 hypothetical protein D927_02556 [Enterococcus faecalis 02-MB-BW-10]EPH79116.1 hypothetical protein D925_02576 [Enterococcus faecalis B83616-1]